MPVILAIALAGAAGALCRYGLGLAVQTLAGGFFPWSTFAVNMAGCLLFGWCWAAFLPRMGPVLFAAVFAGFLASFTTFSTLAFETISLVEEGRPLLGLCNLALHNLLGIGAVALGLWLGRP